ncbi:uncharacterized protein LOC144119243 [Amblyomma americanum]
MSDADKIKHILKGIEDDEFQMLVSKNPQTISDVVSLCQSYDEVRKQRLVTRRTICPDDTLSSLAVSSPAHDQSNLLQQIQQFVREKVARQLSLVTCPPAPTPMLSPFIQRVIQEQVAEVLSPANPPPVVTAPLTYAEAVVRPQPQPVVPAYAPPCTVFPDPPLAPTMPHPHRPLPRTAPRPLNPWRTQDNRPICYTCGLAGHVAPSLYLSLRLLPLNPPVVASSPPFGLSYAPSVATPPSGKLGAAVPEARTVPSPTISSPIAAPVNILEVLVEGVPVHALIDTGAAVSIISRNLCRKLKEVTMPLSEISLRTASADPIRPLAACTARLIIQGLSYTIEFFVLARSSHDIILGWDFLSAHHAIIDCARGQIDLSPLCDTLVDASPATAAHILATDDTDVPAFSSVLVPLTSRASRHNC